MCECQHQYVLYYRSTGIVFQMLVNILMHFFLFFTVIISHFSSDVSNENFPKNDQSGKDTCSLRNVDCEILWVFVGKIREILGVSVGKGFCRPSFFLIYRGN